MTGTDPVPPATSDGRVPGWAVVVISVVALAVVGLIGVGVARLAGPVEATSVRPPVFQPVTEGPSPTPSPFAEPSGEPVEPQPTAVPEASSFDPTTQPADQPPDPDARTVDLGDGLTVEVPAGWEPVTPAGGGGLMLVGDEAVAWISTAPGFERSNAGEVALQYAGEVLTGQLDGFTVGTPEPVTVDSASVVSAARLPYSGALVGQQGSMPLEGDVWVFLRQDGTALVVDVARLPGAEVDDDVTTIVSSLLAGF